MINYFKKAKRLLVELWLLFFITDKRTFFRYFTAIITSLPAIIKQNGLNPATKKMNDGKYTFKVFGKSVTLDGKYWGRATELYVRKVYFTLPEFRLTKDMTVVDLGAEVGSFTVLAAKLADRVIAVEAMPSSLNKIRENAKENKVLEKIEIVWGIVGSRSGMFANPSIRKSHLGDTEPPHLSFKQLLRERGIDVVDFLKIDIEGSEFDLFQDKEVSDWLSRVRYITMEAHTTFLNGDIEVPCGDIGQLREILEENNFKVWLVNLDQKIVSELKTETGYLFAKNLSFQGN